MKQMIQLSNIKYLSALLGFLLLLACNKTKIEPVETYPESPKALVKFLAEEPSPAIGEAGSVVTFNVSGLQGKTNFTFIINQLPAEVVEVGATTVKVKIPEEATTGACAVLIDGEYYFGPTFTIRGNISIDPAFDLSGSMTTGPIDGITPIGGEYLIYGGFSNYANKSTETEPITGIAKINTNGGFVSRFIKGKGLNGNVFDVAYANGKYLLTGPFSQVDQITNIYGIARFNSDGSLDTMKVDIIEENADPVHNPDAGKAWVSSFNGGIGNGFPDRIFYNTTYGVTCIGSFNIYVNNFYERSTKESPALDMTNIYQIARMNENGGLDTTFNLKPREASNKARQGYPCGNGFIYDGLQLDDGRIVLVGNFTQFTGLSAKTVNYITCINPLNGLVDDNFNIGGNGADGSINHITYNKQTGKILLSGDFKHYNGVAVNGVAMIHADGSIDASFSKFGFFNEGSVSYAGQLNDGKILVSGTFNKYNYKNDNNIPKSIIRPGLIILNADGSLAENCNNFGFFRGALRGFAEQPASLLNKPVILVGSFDRFDGKKVGNIVKILIRLK